MSNFLKVSHQEAIRSLLQKGWSQRRIARELGINRRTVRRYVEGESKCTTISTPGSGEQSDAKCTTISIPGAQRMTGRDPAVAVGDQWGRKSRCKPFEAAIDWKTEAGLSAQRIYQDLGGGDFRPWRVPSACPKGLVPALSGKLIVAYCSASAQTVDHLKIWVQAEPLAHLLIGGNVR